MLKYIQIDTFFEALQVWMLHIDTLLGLCLIFIILLSVITRIPKIFDPLEKISKKSWLDFYIFQNSFIRWVSKTILHAIIGVILIFFSSAITWCLYINQWPRISAWEEHIWSIQNAYKRIGKNIEKLQYTRQQREGVLIISSILPYAPVGFIVIFTIAGLFFMFWSLASFFQKISYFFFCLCFFWYLWSLIWTAYIELSWLIHDQNKTQAVKIITS